MKTLKIAVAALVIAGGTFGAFAFTKAEKSDNKVLTTYYAIEDSPGSMSYHWSTSVPAGFECLPTGRAVCSVQANSQPTNNQLPSGTTSENKVYRAIEE
jgi:hypothetical protein